MSKSKVLIAASLAVAGALGTGAAQARDDVQWSVTIGSNAPAVAVHAPVYHHAVPVHPARRGGYLPYRHDVDRDGIPNWRDRHDDRRGGHAWYSRKDVDRDGIPNWHDRYDNRRFGGHPRARDHDGDGIPNWRDRYDNRRWYGR
jgi:hypothetical protein